MTGNISYLTDFKEFDGRYVAFRGGAKGGKITGKGIIRTADKSHVLLKVPRKKNMYSVDMKNIVPTKDLTCLVAKATNDESMLWHRRLGHINFKNINKLVKENLVRGDAPKWLFDIDVLIESMNYVPVIAGPSQDYILMPLWNYGSIFDSSLKDSDGDNKDNDGACKESEIDNQERPNAKNVNTVRQSDDFFGADNDMRSLDVVEVYISNISTAYPVPNTPNTRIHKDHSLDNVIGDTQSGVQTRRMTITTDEQRFISAIYEEKTHEDLYTCLFACFLSQEEPKRITNVLKDPAWVEMDVKSAFLYGRIKEDVYVCQPLGFEDPGYPDKVYKVEKVLYGLHQAPRAWYETLAKYLLDNGFHRGKIDQTLFIKRQKEDILLIQVYVDDIIFGSTKKELWLQVKQKSDRIFISQDKYIDEILRKFKYTDVKPASTLMDKEKAFIKDSDGDDVDVHIYRKTRTRTRRMGHRIPQSNVPSSVAKDEEASLDKEDSPKQGRMIEEINEDENTNLVKISKHGEIHETTEHRKESDDTEVVDFSTGSPQKDDDEETLAETLVSIKKSVAKDKGKAIMQEFEPLKKIKKKEMMQISLDEEITQRAEEKRNKPPTQAQQRTYMSNYIKNMRGYTLKQLKQFSFEEIKMLFDQTIESIRNFVLMESEDQIADFKAGEESSKEGESLKRPAKEELEYEQQKKQQVEEEIV
nr:putative ribonuclease H-like domain-containing protein [Tanacetum cinerariifolium]